MPRARCCAQAASETRVIDYRPEGGHLFKSYVIDYQYPDDPTRYDLRESTFVYKGKFKPDGYGAVTVDDRSRSKVQMTGFWDVPVEDNWMSIPKFGEWENLTDPAYGERAGEAAMR